MRIMKNMNAPDLDNFLSNKPNRINTFRIARIANDGEPIK